MYPPLFIEKTVCYKGPMAPPNMGEFPENVQTWDESGSLDVVKGFVQADTLSVFRGENKTRWMIEKWEGEEWEGGHQWEGRKGDGSWEERGRAREELR